MRELDIAKPGLVAFVVLSALVLLVFSACGSAADAGTDRDQQDSPDADFVTRSADAGIAWTWPAEEIAGLTQQIVGESAEAVVIVHREGEEPSPDAAIYLHGWGVSPPSSRSDQMRNLVNRGYTVIYPVYQVVDTPAEETGDNAVAGIRAAVEELDPDPESLIAIGDVTGGAIAFDYAARASELGLPTPRLLVAIHPGREPDGLIPPADHSQIPPDTRILIATSTNHQVPDGDELIREMLADTSQIPDQRRDLFVAEPDAELSIADSIGDSYSKIWRAISAWLDRNGALGTDSEDGG